MDNCLMRKFTWKGQLKKGISSDDKEKEGLFSSKLKMVLFGNGIFLEWVDFRFHDIDFSFHSSRGSSM